MWTSLPDGLFVKLSLVAAAIWLASVFGNTTTYGTSLDETIAFMTVGVIAILSAGLGFQSLYYHLQARVQKPGRKH